MILVYISYLKDENLRIKLEKLRAGIVRRVVMDALDEVVGGVDVLDIPCIVVQGMQQVNAPRAKEHVASALERSNLP